jgi:hypothetical protein
MGALAQRHTVPSGAIFRAQADAGIGEGSSKWQDSQMKVNYFIGRWAILYMSNDLKHGGSGAKICNTSAAR